MQTDSIKIDYNKWNHIVLKAQLVIALGVFLTEVINNALLYITRSQGYGPDTIALKLIRYLLIPTFINFFLIVISNVVVLKISSNMTKKLVLMACITAMCSNTACTHYQFASTLVIFVIPIIISILYEDLSLSVFILILSFVGQTVAIFSRAADPLYKKDIVPEAAIAYMFSVTIFIFARIINVTLRNRRNELSNALVSVEKANAAAEKASMSLKVLETLAKTIDAKDKYTKGHSSRVADYATLIAQHMGWSDSDIKMLRYEALLHDIGKIGIPDEVLNKPAKLTAKEFNIIKTHPVVGASILKDMVIVPNANVAARHHHERYDGTGYPDSLKGEEIPVNARIICIADAYDAMNSDRLYRKALSKEVIRDELIKGRGTQFDPVILDVFLELFDNSKLEIKPDAIGHSVLDQSRKAILNDIEDAIRNISSSDESDSSFNNFKNLYYYMEKISKRYSHTIDMISIVITPNEFDTIPVVSESACETLELAIRKNIRAVDIYYRYSEMRHLIVLLDAGKENLDIVTQRINYDFSNKEISKDYSISFETMNV